MTLLPFIMFWCISSFHWRFPSVQCSPCSRQAASIYEPVQFIADSLIPDPRFLQTYGIPSISSILVATGQLSDKDTAPKRNADTGALLLEAVLNPPTSERAITAITRINYIHRHYRKVGKIRDSDLLYTLSLFALEPARWVSRFEWRTLSDMELCAIGTFWKSLGEALEVPFDELSKSASEKDGLGWLNELSAWSRAYEDANMVPANSNKRLAYSTFELILWKMPRSLHGIGRKILATLLDDKLRESMLYGNLCSFNLKGYC